MTVAPLLMIALDRRAVRMCSASDLDVRAAVRVVRGLNGLVVLRTCERFEVYASTADAEPGDLLRALNIGDDSLVMSVRRGVDVVRHLFRVASGLESRLIGEPHVLGQVRRAAALAHASAVIGAQLHALFAAATRCGRCARRQTALGCAASTYADLAFERVTKHLRDVAAPRIVILGSGSVAGEIARGLRDRCCAHLTIAGRHDGRTSALAAVIGARWTRLSELNSALNGAHAIIAATSAQTPLLTAEHVAHLRHSPCIIDLGMPANVDDVVRAAHHISYFGLDDLAPARHPVATILKAAQQIVSEQVARFVRRHQDIFQHRELGEHRGQETKLHEGARNVDALPTMLAALQCLHSTTPSVSSVFSVLNQSAEKAA